jgi:hypothetical protein
MAHTKVRVKLVGEDSNAYSILGRVSKALKRSDQSEAADEYLARATDGDYNHLLAVTMEYAYDEGDIEEDDVQVDEQATGEAIGFTVQDKIVVADPCYIDTNDTLEGLDRLGLILDDCHGGWIAEAVVSDEGSWGSRVKVLRATRCGAGPVHEKRCLCHNGVDSGQMFVGCVTSFPLDYNALLERYKGPDGEWNNELKFFAFAKGAVSGTGFGDGSYPVTVGYDSGGHPVSIEVKFLDNESRDEEEEDDEG